VPLFAAHAPPQESAAILLHLAPLTGGIESNRGDTSSKGHGLVRGAAQDGPNIPEAEILGLVLSNFEAMVSAGFLRVEAV